jgi:hypothetical protein
MPPARRDRRLGAAGRVAPAAGPGGAAPVQFITWTAQHYSCGVCGIYTYRRRRSDPCEYGYNVGCLDGVDPYALAIAVPVGDGVHHRADRAAP